MSGDAVHRIGNYPVVISAVSQVTNLYDTVKNTNGVLKYTLESAEVVSGKLTGATVPVVTTRLHGTIENLDKIACHQLDKLEKNYPIVTEPTDKVLEVPWKVYESTLKPTVDRVSTVSKYGLDTVDAVTTYTSNKVENAKHFTTSSIVDMKDYSLEKAVQIKDFGILKIDEKLKTPNGQKVAAKLDCVMDVVDRYIDSYFPAAEGETGQQQTGEMNTVTRFKRLSAKIQERILKRALHQLLNTSKRASGILTDLVQTVDLIQDFRLNFDKANDKFWSVVHAVNDYENTNESTPKNQTFEQKAIKRVQQLTYLLKMSFTAGNETVMKFIPKQVVALWTIVARYTEDLYQTFKNQTNFDELSSQFLASVRQKISHVNSMLIQMAHLIMNTWPMNKLILMKESISKEEKPIVSEQNGNTNGALDLEMREEFPAEQNEVQLGDMKTIEINKACTKSNAGNISEPTLDLEMQEEFPQIDIKEDDDADVKEDSMRSEFENIDIWLPDTDELMTYSDISSIGEIQWDDLTFNETAGEKEEPSDLNGNDSGKSETQTDHEQTVSGNYEEKVDDKLEAGCCTEEPLITELVQRKTVIESPVILDNSILSTAADESTDQSVMLEVLDRAIEEPVSEDSCNDSDKTDSVPVENGEVSSTSAEGHPPST
ncbi:perilipin-3-like isoform X2 [Tubulanus polymorphus]|uniref:perilipin-3-like isoform X2 n=1 Tax=Tubulanus polymorphus TaxID=672921 RepID=UPI003DA5D81E